MKDGYFEQMINTPLIKGFLELHKERNEFDAWTFVIPKDDGENVRFHRSKVDKVEFYELDKGKHVEYQLEICLKEGCCFRTQLFQNEEVVETLFIMLTEPTE